MKANALIQDQTILGPVDGGLVSVDGGFGWEDGDLDAEGVDLGPVDGDLVSVDGGFGWEEGDLDAEEVDPGPVTHVIRDGLPGFNIRAGKQQIVRIFRKKFSQLKLAFLSKNPNLAACSPDVAQASTPRIPLQSSKKRKTRDQIQE